VHIVELPSVDALDRHSTRLAEHASIRRDAWRSATCALCAYWSEPERGGHFAAFEQPKLFVAEVCAFLRVVVTGTAGGLRR